jgi:hypothetical protein
MTLKHQSDGPECPSDSIPYLASIHPQNGKSMNVSQNVSGTEITIIVTPAAMCPRIRFLEEDLIINTVNDETTITIASKVKSRGTLTSVILTERFQKLVCLHGSLELKPLKVRICIVRSQVFISPTAFSMRGHHPEQY